MRRLRPPLNATIASVSVASITILKQEINMSNSWKTQYVKASVAETMPKNELQPGQWVPEDKSEFISEGYKLKRAYLKKGGNVKFSHGKNLEYFAVMKQATRMGMLWASQPLQVEEAIGRYPIRKLRALIAIAEVEIDNKLSEQI